MRTGFTTRRCDGHFRTDLTAAAGMIRAALSWVVPWVVVTVAAAPPAIAAKPALANKSEWLTYRYNGQQTSTSEGSAHLDTAPATRWRIFLGGEPIAALTQDLDIDIEDDVITVESGAVIARRSGGQVLWRTKPFGASAIVGRPRLATDATRAIAVRSGAGVVVLHIANGKTAFATPAGAFEGPVLIAFADADGDGFDELFVADNGGHAAAVDGGVRVFHLGSGKLLSQTPAKDASGEPASGTIVGVIDVDGDGNADIFGGHQTAVGEGVAFAYRGIDGTIIAQSAAGVGRSCGQVGLAPRPNAAPLLLCAGNFGAASSSWAFRGVAAFERVGPTLERRWLWQAANGEADLVSLPFVHGDLDGDGSHELLAAVRQGGVWQTLAWDGATGALLKAGKAPLRRILAQGSAGTTLLLGGVDGPGGGVADATTIGRWSRKNGLTASWQLGPGLLGVVPPSTADNGGEATAATLLWHARDSDGDASADVVDLLTLGSDDKASLAAHRAFTGPVSVRATGIGSDGGRRLLVCERNGAGWWLDGNLVVRNDGDSDGAPDLRYGVTSTASIRAAPRTRGGDDWRVVIADAGHVMVADPSSADPIVAPVTTSIWRGFAGLTRATLADVDGDDSRELILRTTDAKLGPVLSVVALGPSPKRPAAVGGTTLWSYVHGDASIRWSNTNGDAFALHDVDGDGGQDILATYAGSGATPANGWRTFVRGSDGAPLWQGDNPCVMGERQQLSIADDSDATTGILSLFYTRLRCNLADGAVVESKVSPGPVQYGVAVLASLPTIPGLSAVYAFAFGGVAAEREDFGVLWGEKTQEFKLSGGALIQAPQVDGSTRPTLVTARNRHTWVAFDATTGATLWTANYAAGARLAAGAEKVDTLFGTPVGVADLTGKGRPSVLFVSSEGILYAINGVTGDVDWSRDYGGAVGTPIVADIDGDGEVEILITTPSGDLEALDRDVLARPAWVRDNDGKGPALDDSADIDVTADSATLRANWAAAEETKDISYFVRVLDSNGGEIAATVNVGAATSANVSDLSLQTGETYFVEVRAVQSGAAGGIESQPRLSDGVRVEDNSDPEIALFDVAPGGAATGATFALRLVAKDATRLAGLSLRVVDAKDAEFAAFSLKTAQRSATLKVDWQSLVAAQDGDVRGGKVALPAGDYRVLAEVSDAAGHVTKAQRNIVLCPANLTFVDGGCGPATNDASAGQGGELGEDGCGCSMRGPAKSPSAGALLIVALLAGLWLWLRSSGTSRSRSRSAALRQ